MSIYSGFATRKMEQNYNNLLSKLILMFQESFLEFMSLNHDHNHTTLERSNFIVQIKVKHFKFILNKMKIYQEHKYLQPKFSQLCNPLRQIIEKNDQKIQATKSTTPLNLNYTPKTSILGKTSTSKSAHSVRKSFCTTKNSFCQKLQEEIIIESPIRKKSKKGERLIKNSPYKKYSVLSHLKTQPDEIYDKRSISAIKKPLEINIETPTPGNSVTSKCRIYKSQDKDQTNITSKTPNSMNNSTYIFKRSNMSSQVSNVHPEPFSNSANVSILHQKSEKTSQNSSKYELKKIIDSNTKLVSAFVKTCQYKKTNRNHIKRILKQEQKLVGDISERKDNNSPSSPTLKINNAKSSPWIQIDQKVSNKKK